MGDDYLSASEFAARASEKLHHRVTRDAINYAIRKGHITAIRRGPRGKWLVPASEMERYVGSNGGG